MVRAADEFARRRFATLVEREALDGAPPGQLADVVVEGFSRLYRPQEENSPPPPELLRVIVDQFHRAYYHSAATTWQQTHYRGVAIWKCPLDLWLYQQILHEVRPDLVVETGTAYGGSGYYLADLCQLLGTGEVVSIDITPQPNLPRHDRLTYLTGSSTDPAVVQQVRDRAGDGRVLVILDSDHSQIHVEAELKTYAPLVSLGSYLIVEDSNINGHPALPDFGPGPWEAVDAFMADRTDFLVDETQHRLLMTFNPRGYLRRIA